MHNNAMLRMMADRYARADLPAREDHRGVYFPDSVVQPFVDVLPPLASSSADISMTPSRLFLLEEARELIVAAFHDFHPRLGPRAEELFATAQVNPRPAQDFLRNEDYVLDIGAGTRWNIHDVPPGTTPRLMRSLPAFSERSEYDPSNPNPYAVIEFDFDGTIDSVIYMVHEAGHALADDNIVKPDGYRYGDNRDPFHMLETQAYFAQHIVTDFLKRHSDPSIADAARGHHLATMRDNIALVAAAAKAVDSAPGAARDQAMETLHFRPMAILSADAVFQHVANQGDKARAWAADVMLGHYGPKNITQVLAAVGIEIPGQMTALAAQSLHHAVRGLPVIKPESYDDKGGGTPDIVGAAPKIG